MKRAITHYTPLLVYVLFVVLLPYFSFKHSAPTFHGADKLVHMFLYLPMPILLFRHFKTSHIQLLNQHWFWITIICCITFAAIDEIHQQFVPSRFSDFLDWVADMTGILMGTGIYLLFSKLRKKST